MSDKDIAGGDKKGSGWTDRERLVYLVALVEQSAPKLDYNNTPRPNGRSKIACERMVQRLKDTLKEDLVALKAGQPTATEDSGTVKTPKTPKTPKRKTKAVGDEEGSPKKRGRPAKKDKDADEVKAEAELPIKAEEDDDGAEGI